MKGNAVAIYTGCDADLSCQRQPASLLPARQDGLLVNVLDLKADGAASALFSLENFIWDIPVHVGSP